MLESLLLFVVDIIAYILFELAIGSIAQVFRLTREVNPIYAVIGLILSGAVIGLLMCIIFPDLQSPNPQIALLSLILIPLMVGCVMGVIGRVLKIKNRKTTALVTFWGGTLFAFSAALVRFLIIG